jgi:FKBP-type peptidyl-prolyl cis-trans isomerase SlpA
MKSSTVAYGDSLTLRYALRLRDGAEIVSNFDEPEPDTLTLGDGTLAQTLEQWLIGVVPGERHVFLLDPWQAFGVSQPELVQTLPKSDLPAAMEFELDSLVEFSMPNGQTVAGRILEIAEDAIKVDFNHPLADLPIEFEVEIIRILPPLQALSSPSGGSPSPQPSTPAGHRGPRGRGGKR